MGEALADRSFPQRLFVVNKGVSRVPHPAKAFLHRRHLLAPFLSKAGRADQAGRGMPSGKVTQIFWSTSQDHISKRRSHVKVGPQYSLFTFHRSSPSSSSSQILIPIYLYHLHTEAISPHLESPIGCPLSGRVLVVFRLQHHVLRFIVCILHWSHGFQIAHASIGIEASHQHCSQQ